MIRIVHIVPEDGIGGVEVAAQSQAATNTKDHHFRLIFIARNGSGRSSLNPLAHWRSLMEARREHPDVIIFSLWKSVPIALMLKVLFPRAAFVFTLNNETTTHFLEAAFSGVGIAIADEVWADSRQSLDARLTGRRKIGRVISFIVDRPVPPKLRQPDYLFVSWSRLSSQKGIDRSIGLIARMVENGHDARLDVWGPDDGEKGRLEQLIATSELGDRVKLKGPIDRAQLPSIAAKAAFFLLPSRFEGLAMACVEAMQLGLVPVATAVGAMTDYVIPGKTGILVDPDKLGPAIDEIVALVENPEQYALVRERAIQRWRDAPLYAEDMFNACLDVYGKSRRVPNTA